MDIQIPSNLERLLFEVSGHDHEAVAVLQAHLKSTGTAQVPEPWLEKIKSEFTAAAVDDAATTKAIADFYASHGRLIDPHTAVGVVVAKQSLGDNAMVVSETASPAKFPKAIEAAVPDVQLTEFDKLLELEERYEVVPADVKLANYLS